MEKRCLQKIVTFRTFAQCAKIIFALKLKKGFKEIKDSTILKSAKDWDELQKYFSLIQL